MALRPRHRTQAAVSTRPVALARWAAGLCALVLAGCAGSPPPPEWQMNAHGAMERALEAYLSGQTRVADAELARARSEIARTGRPELLARAELMRCAVQVASLDLQPCTAFEPLAADAAPAEQAYARYLEGRLVPADAALLPEAQRGPAAAASAASVAAVADPQSRLVAAGVLFRRGLADPAVISSAIDTASAQGWRRPLLAWLKVEQARAERSGAGDAARRLQRRIELVEQGASGR